MARHALTKLYQDLNQRFFDGRLPRFRVTLSNTFHRCRGECVPERRLIRVSRALDRESLRRVLLHEMCHIGTSDHGRRFRAKLARLARLGETWAAAEAEHYRNAPSWNEEMANLRAKLDEVAQETPRPRFSALVRWIAQRHFGLPSREFLRRVPWLQAAWRNACTKAERARARRACLKLAVQRGDGQEKKVVKE